MTSRRAGQSRNILEVLRQEDVSGQMRRRGSPIMNDIRVQDILESKYRPSWQDNKRHPRSSLIVDANGDVFNNNDGSEERQGMRGRVYTEIVRAYPDRTSIPVHSYLEMEYAVMKDYVNGNGNDASPYVNFVSQKPLQTRRTRDESEDSDNKQKVRLPRIRQTKTTTHDSNNTNVKDSKFKPSSTLVLPENKQQYSHQGSSSEHTSYTPLTEIDTTNAIPKRRNRVRFNITTDIIQPKANESFESDVSRGSYRTIRLGPDEKPRPALRRQQARTVWEEQVPPPPPTQVRSPSPLHDPGPKPPSASSRDANGEPWWLQRI